MKYECMDSLEVKSDELTDNGGAITFKGWNIPNPEKIVLDNIKNILEKINNGF